MAFSLNRKLSIVVYRVTDWERAKKFYGEALGLKLKFAVDKAGWAEYVTGAGKTTLAINRYRDGKRVPRNGGAVMVFEVPDLDKAVRILKRRGVKFAKEVVEVPGHDRHIDLYDPDRNKLQLVQYLKK